MAYAIVFTIGLVAGVVATVVFGRKVSTLLANALTKTAAKVGNKG